MKKYLSVLLLIVLLFSLCACGEVMPKDFSAEGMTITLTSAFRENTQPGYTVCYDSSKVAVFVLKEPFTLQAGIEDMSLDEYAELIRTSNASKSPSAISHENDLTSIEYTFFNEAENLTYKYYCVMFKSADAFWLVQFACVDSDYAAYEDSFVTWAKSIKFGA